jgi:hypothetical protein
VDLETFVGAIGEVDGMGAVAAVSAVAGMGAGGLLLSACAGFWAGRLVAGCGVGCSVALGVNKGWNASWRVLEVATSALALRGVATIREAPAAVGLPVTTLVGGCTVDAGVRVEELTARDAIFGGAACP